MSKICKPEVSVLIVLPDKFVTMSARNLNDVLPHSSLPPWFWRHIGLLHSSRPFIHALAFFLYIHMRQNVVHQMTFFFYSAIVQGWLSSTHSAAVSTFIVARRCELCKAGDAGAMLCMLHMETNSKICNALGCVLQGELVPMQLSPSTAT